MRRFFRQPITVPLPTTTGSTDIPDELFDTDAPEPALPEIKPPAVVLPPKGTELLPQPKTPPAEVPRPRASDGLDKVLNVGRTRRKKMPLWRKLLIWALLIGGLVFVAMRPYPFTVGGEFIVQPLERIQVRARTDGEITELNVEEGDWVEKDDILAILSKWDELRDIAVREAELDRLNAEYETLIAGPKVEEVALAKQAVAAAKAEVDDAAENLDRQERLFASGIVAQKGLTAARTRHLVAQAEHSKTEAALALLQSSALESEIAAARAAIARVDGELAFSRLKLEQTNVRAVSTGQIVSSLNKVSIGTYLDEGDLFAELADNRTVHAEIEVPETEIDEVKLGATATLKLWSAPISERQGTVKRMAPAAEEREFGRVVRVIVEVPNADGALAENMTGFGKIEVNERPVWRVFSRALVRFFEIELWSWVP